jgi:ABC-type multidrug transport system ATPase subunit
MQLYANIKCIPIASSALAVDALLEQLDLKLVMNRVAGTLSGGNKRKLSAAIALLGEPAVVFLGKVLMLGRHPRYHSRC